jgi:putative ABC transport system substrate-binding protein
VVGFLRSDANPETLRALREGLKAAGFVEDENVTVEYRSADGQLDRLPALAADLVRRRVTVIVAGGGPAAIVAVKTATSTIPIVFNTGSDPVKLGLVASLARPGGNLTGVSFLAVELTAKRLELLRDMVPAAKHVAVLVSPANAAITEATLRDVHAAANAMGLRIRVLNADTSTGIDAAFEPLMRERPEALFISSGPFFTERRVQLTQWAARLSVPAVYAGRHYCEVGGLISYSASLSSAYRQVGEYVGRILNGAKPADLPVVQSSKFELVINISTARMLGLSVPPTLLSRADAVIE